MRRFYRLFLGFFIVGLCFATPLQDSGVLAVGFSLRPYAPRVGWVVQFTDLSIGNPVSWFWEFGDGVTSILQNPTHVYNTVGDFEVSLTVSNDAGVISTISRR